MNRLRAAGLTFIPPVIAADLEVDRPWFVMPWYEEGSLQDRIEAGGYRADCSAGLTLLTQIAGALRQVHELEIAHRDLKPANIFVAAGEVAIGDLGLCLQIDEDAKGLQVRARRSALGSTWRPRTRPG